MKEMLEHDIHGDEMEYPVTSIYLDDIVFSGASDKAFGNEVHKKYRIRHYHDKEQKKLELKHKVGDESTKQSSMITQKVYQAIIDQDMDVLELYFDDPLIRQFTIDMLRFNMLPKLIIYYKREAYKDSTDNLRITFDHSLSSDLFDEDYNDIDFPLLGGDKLILEIKYQFYLPDNIKAILDKINLNQIAYSKYFMGYSSLNI
jgi:hypothetical protein